MKLTTSTYNMAEKINTSINHYFLSSLAKMEEKLSTIYDETPKIEIQINEVPIKEEISIDVQDRYHHGYMTGFPYQKNIDGYFIHKKKQKEIIWGQLLSPQTCCSSASKDEIIWKVK